MRMMTGLLAFAMVFAFAGSALAEAPAEAAVKAPTETRSGDVIFMMKCKVCHGADGVATKAGLKKESPENLFVSIKDWTEEQIVKNVTEGKNKMPTFGPREGKKSKLTPEEIAAVAKYVISMKK